MNKLVLKKSNIQIIDFVVYFCITIFLAYNLMILDYSRSDTVVVITFFVIGLFSYYKIISAKTNISVNRILYIFCFIFMFFAPLQQYLAGTIIWKSTGLTAIYSDEDYFLTNILLIAFLLVYEVSYNFIGKKISLNTKKSNAVLEKFQKKDTDFSLFVINCISLIAIAFLLVTNNLFDTSSLDTENSSLSSQIIKIIRFLPVACFLIVYLQRKKYQNSKFSLSLCLYAIEIILIYFPFYGSISRFLLFGVYLMIIALFCSHMKTRSIFFLIFVVGFFVVFSAFNFFKTHDYSDIQEFSLEIVNFKTVDYDAYQLFMLVIKYCKAEDIVYGKNLISALLNFIPRGIWTGKLYPSGQLVSGYFGTWYTNISCPWFAEWYFAFGWVGILVGGLVSGILFKYIDGFVNSTSWAKKSIFCCIAGLEIFILRGALLPGLSYLYALMIAIFIVYFVVLCCSKFILFNKKRVNLKI